MPKELQNLLCLILICGVVWQAIRLMNGRH